MMRKESNYIVHHTNSHNGKACINTFPDKETAQLFANMVNGTVYGPVA